MFLSKAGHLFVATQQWYLVDVANGFRLIGVRKHPVQPQDLHETIVEGLPFLVALELLLLLVVLELLLEGLLLLLLLLIVLELLLERLLLLLVVLEAHFRGHN